MIFIIHDIAELYGRQINSQLVSENILTDSRVVRINSLKLVHGIPVCQRCGAKLNRKLAQLPNDNYYCYACIHMGRVDSLSQLITVAEPNMFSVPVKPLAWSGNLTSSQSECSKAIVNIVDNLQTHLLWAVTGAGKTEMIFAGIEKALLDRKRVAIASPRIDVINELYPRLKAAFPNTKICLLHGRTDTRYQYSQLTVCTTHQLLRFRRAFDLLIIDEVDVFPYAGNPQLHFAAGQAAKTRASRLYLTATPDDYLLKLIKKKKITTSYLPRRYHGYPLPEITVKKTTHLRQMIDQGKLPTAIIKIIKQIVGRQLLLIFVPKISDLSLVGRALALFSKDWLYETVHSADPQRIEKVQAMRDGKLDFLITTTILERGVTFRNLSVIVLNADNDIFGTPALVQIAGRVGRSADYPSGLVQFFVEQRTAKIKAAQMQIKKMNKMKNET